MTYKSSKCQQTGKFFWFINLFVNFIDIFKNNRSMLLPVTFMYTSEKMDVRLEKQTAIFSSPEQGSGWAIVITCRPSSVVRRRQSSSVRRASVLTFQRPLLCNPWANFLLSFMPSLQLKWGWKFVQIVMVR